MARRNRKIGEILVDMQCCTSDDVTYALAEQHDIELVDLSGVDIPSDVIEQVPQDLARGYNVIPIELADGGLNGACFRVELPRLKRLDE